MATAAKAKVETISTRQLAGQLAEKHELSQKSRQRDAGRHDRPHHQAPEEGRPHPSQRSWHSGRAQARPRMGRNPATGEAIKIKASKKVAFRAAKELKEAI